MNILIFGSKGFVGSACERFFSQKNNVVTADIVGEELRNHAVIKSVEDIERVISSGKFDLLINASGSANVVFSFTNPKKDYEMNVLNVRHMLDALRKYNADCRFINFSSAAVYGNPVSLPVKENSALHPLSPYGKHKMQSEEFLKSYTEQFGLHTCNLRVFSAYGPGLRKQLFWDIFKKWQENNGIITLFGTGKESRDFIYIDDLIQAIAIVIKNAPFNADVINVASGVETTIKDAATIFASFLPGKPKVIFNGFHKAGDPKSWCADISLMRSLGYEASTSIHQGLKITKEDYIKKNIKI